MQLVIVRYIHENKEEQNLPPTGTKKYNMEHDMVFLDAGHSIFSFPRCRSFHQSLNGY